MDALAHLLRVENPNLVEALPDQLAALRNGLSHGRSYPDEALQPWLRPIDIIFRATLMRLLGFNLDEIAATFSEHPWTEAG